jgi:hypothetical protein
VLKRSARPAAASLLTMRIAVLASYIHSRGLRTWFKEEPDVQRTLVDPLTSQAGPARSAEMTEVFLFCRAAR